MASENATVENCRQETAGHPTRNRETMWKKPWIPETCCKETGITHNCEKGESGGNSHNESDVCACVQLLLLLLLLALD
jgi:hypothetical protein